MVLPESICFKSRWINPLHSAVRCHPGDDAGHRNISCKVPVEDICEKGHVTRRPCSKAPSPCSTCKRQRALAEREAKNKEEARLRREQERDKAIARLAEARRIATEEHEKLRHGLELLRLERETQRAEVDAEAARASADRVRESFDESPASNGNEEPNDVEENATKQSETPSLSKRKERIDLAARNREDELCNRFHAQKPGPLPAKANSRDRKKKVTPNAGDAKNTGAQTSPLQTGLPPSTLRLMAQAAAKGSAQDILAALEAVPKHDYERASHDLYLAVGSHAEDWFPPRSGIEPAPSSPPTGRTAQALSLISAGEWIKARMILAKIVQEESEQPCQSAGSRDPSALFMLSLCDVRVAGGSAAEAELEKLATVGRELWPGPPDGNPPPTARAFPLGALVYACLEAEVASHANPQAAKNDTADGRQDDVTDDDPADNSAVRACAWALAFLRAPDGVRKAGGVSGRMWTSIAESVVKKHGTSLATALWGSGGAMGGETSGDGKRTMTTTERVSLEWKNLQLKSGVTSEAMDELLEMSGLDTIKLRFLNIARSAVLDRERGYDLAERSYNIRLEGNPGTGKGRSLVGVGCTGVPGS